MVAPCWGFCLPEPIGPGPPEPPLFFLPYQEPSTTVGTASAATLLSACGGDSPTVPNAPDAPPPPQPTETVPPQVVSTTPSNGAHGIAVGAIILVQFSEAVSPATVTSSSLTVTGPSGPVAGSITVSGSAVTFEPAVELEEFSSRYEVRVTTGVQDLAGNALPATFTFSFETIVVQIDQWYRLSNLFLGLEQSLDTFSDSRTCFMADTGDFSGQFWRFVPEGEWYVLQSRFGGATQALDGSSSVDPCGLTDLLVAATAERSPDPAVQAAGQLWSLVSLNDGYFRLQNQQWGDTRSLDTAPIEGSGIPYMAVTGDFTGQFWELTRAGAVESEPPTLTLTQPAPDAEGVGIATVIQAEFSEPIDPLTVTAETFVVTGPEGPVPGTRSVEGEERNVVTFFPDGGLVEFSTSYDVRLTTGIRDEAGNALESEHGWSFTTLLVDPLHWYRLSNQLFGDSRALDTYSDTKQCFMGVAGDFSGQFWRFEPSGERYLMKNLLGAELLALEGADGVTACFLTGVGPSTRQLWTIVDRGDGYFRLHTQSFGTSHSLDTRTGQPGVPFMGVTGPTTGQAWKIRRIGPID